MEFSNPSVQKRLEELAVSNVNEFIRFEALTKLDKLDVTRRVTNRDIKRHEKDEE